MFMLFTCLASGLRSFRFLTTFFFINSHCLVQHLANSKAFPLSLRTPSIVLCGVMCAVFIYFLVGVMKLVDRLLVITDLFLFFWSNFVVLVYYLCRECSVLSVLCFGVRWCRGWFLFFLVMVYFYSDCQFHSFFIVKLFFVTIRLNCCIWWRFCQS